MRPIAEIIVHCTATKREWMLGKPINAIMGELRRWHVQGNGWRDLGYHYVIDRAGNVGLGRPVAMTGAHTRGHNTGTIGVALVGGHGAAATDKFADHFTSEQDAALRELIDTLKGEHPTIQKVSGHNEYSAKGCPGFQVDMWLATGAAEKPMKPDPAPRGLFGYIRSFFWLLGKR